MNRVVQAVGAVALLLVCVCLTSAGAAAGSAPVQPGAFQGTTSAYGARLTTVTPGAPAADVLIDSGGPTAQASLSSIGVGTGYASFPDPGSFVGGLPGLVQGLTAGKTPFPLPLPNYPLTAVADDSQPHSSIDAGAYKVAAAKSAEAVTAEALSGLTFAGNVALVRSDASVTVQANGSVVATAIADVEGLTVGPITFGQIRSTATKTMAPDGTITTTQSIALDAVRVGALQIPIPVDAINATGAGKSIPLALGPIAEKLLGSSDITFSAATAQTTKDTVIAPVLQLSFPLPKQLVDGIGASSGQATLTLGYASATLTGAAAPPPYTAPPSGNGTTAGGGQHGSTGGSTGSGGSSSGGSTGSSGGSTGSFGGTGGTGGTGSTGSLGAPTAPLAAGTPAPTSGAASGGGAVNGAPTDAGGLALAGALQRLSGAFGVADLYLIVAIGAMVALAVGFLIRVMGVRAPWTSTGG